MTRPGGIRTAGSGDPRRALLLVLLVCLGSALSKLLLLEPVGPIVFFDELLYMQGAKALAGLQTYPSGQYPFGYPLVLAPAVALGAGYDGIYLANVVMSSLLPLAAWLLAREVTSPARAMLAAVLSCLLPFHYLYPTQVMAESLYIPLFVLCTWYAVRGRFDGVAMAAAFGAVLAFTFVTKYIALPGVVLLLVYWLATLAATGRRAALPAASAAAVAAGALVLGAWLAYADSQGIGVREALGGKVSGLKAGELITVRALATWTLLYAAAALLMCGPFLGVLLWRAAESAPRWLRPSSWTPMDRLLLLLLMLGGGYVLVCVQHSAGAVMNYPVPQRIIVRYLMHLTPLVVVVGVAGAGGRGGVLRVAMALASALLLYAAWWLFYGGNVFGLPHWFADIPLYSADIMVFKAHAVAALVAVASLALPFLTGGWPLAFGGLAVAGLLLAGAKPLLAQGQSLTSVRPMHARALVPLLLDAADAGDRTLVRSGFRRLQLVELQQALQFWGVPRTAFAVVGARQEPPGGDFDRTLLITPDEVPGRTPLLEYAFGGRTGYVYPADADADAIPGKASMERYPDADIGFLARADAPCSDDAAVGGVIEWRFPDGPTGVAVYARQAGGREKLFAVGSATGAQDTGTWVFPHTEFVFRDHVSGEVLKVHAMPPGCGVAP